MERKRKAGLVWLAVIILALALLGYVSWRMGWLDLFTSSEKLRETVKSAGIWAPLVFIFLQIIQVVFSFIPGNVTTIAGGAMFGLWPGFFFSIIGILAGSVLAFYIGVFLGHKVVERLIGKAMMDKYRYVLEKRQTVLFAMMMLLPFFPDDALCMLAGLSSMSFVTFLTILIIFRPLGILFSALVGAGTLSVPIWGWGLIIAVTIACAYYAIKYGAHFEEKMHAIIDKVFRKSSGDEKTPKEEK